MHVIFGASSLVMLVGTIWMLAKDHNREWRRWQLADRAREHWTAEAQLAQAEANSTAKLEDLRTQLSAAQRASIDEQQISSFKQLIAAEDTRLGQSATDVSDIDRSYQSLREAEVNSDAAADARNDVLAAFEVVVREARRRENSLLTEKKFVAADQTAAISARGIAVGEGRSTVEIEQRIGALAAQLVEKDAAVAAAKDYRLALESIVGNVGTRENDLEKQIAAIETEFGRLRENLQRNPANSFQFKREWVNRLPVLDALYTGNVKLDQIWLPDMKINYNFSYVARYDRCIVCHRAIDATAPGTATEPAYPAVPRGEREPIVELSTPPEKPAAEPAGGEAVAGAEPNSVAAPPTLLSVYGIALAPYGQIESDDVTIQFVAPASLAALAGLQTGDVLLEVNGGEIETAADVEHYLFDNIDDDKWGQPLQVKIRRGLNQPFTSHPRLDLFVGSTSPHKKGEMGCTICHDGQGSATDFKWASHTPNDPEQALNWSRDHGWFDNHHWIFPMTPNRFVESNCLKCHHEVVELEPSQRFPEPPAPKLVQGYHLVREYGCYGCHEINGYDGPNKRIGPDLRIEPNYYEVAAQILSDPGLNDAEKELARTVTDRPDDVAARTALLQAIRADMDVTKGASQNPDAAPSEASDEAPQPRLSSATHSLADALRDADTPGSLRRVGPSLRHLASKVEFDWLQRWIRRPADFRPSTRMPQFFLQHEHLNSENKEFPIHDAAGQEVLVSDREYTQRFEGIEVRALAQFLMANSQPLNYLEPPKEVTETASADRGRWLFESRGCLACHSHSEFPDGKSNQGPDLSRAKAKFDSDKGRRWLYSWLKKPNHYHSRTAMPNLFLEPIAVVDATGNPTGQITDPAADIREFLLSVEADWQPEVAAPTAALSADEQAALTDLTAVWLSASFPRRRADEYARQGIPDRLAATVKLDEQVLVGMTPENRVERQLNYVARRSLSRYGCFGCHEIPGYETSKPIGTPLANWGRKDPAQLAFENIGSFLATHGIDGTGAGHAQHADGAATHDESNGATDETSHAASAGAAGAHAHALDPMDEKLSADEGYFIQSLNSHQRNGFLWQKLRMPRTFDFAATRTKRYDERLRMPKFPFTAEEREAVMTFVLGLTSEAPAERYIYKPDPRQAAIVQGRHVLDKYNCAGCHVLDMDRWDIAVAPEWFDEPPAVSDFPLVIPPVTPEQVQASVAPDSRGLVHAELHGQPMRDESTGLPRLVDADGVQIEPDDNESEPHLEFQLYQHAIVNGALRMVGQQQSLLIPARRGQLSPQQGNAYPGFGGDLAKYLYSRVIAEEKKTNPAAVATEAWGWLPPPLHNEGEKVQSAWLHDFLMDPTAIRPAVVMRMPQFHMSSDEASKLVNYFAAKSGAEFPYEYNGRRREGYLASVESTHPTQFDDAMRILTDNNYCVKCHSVGDYQVRGAIRTLGPDLDQVYRRLRPEFVRRWIANPQRILPYTGMPVNIPYDANSTTLGGVSQELYRGTSQEQLDGLVDLILNFDEYAKRQTSIKGLVKEPAQAVPGQPATTATPPNDGNSDTRGG